MVDAEAVVNDYRTLTDRSRTLQFNLALLEIAAAFNRMIDRLQAQTNELVTANPQSESRRALIEAVMSRASPRVCCRRLTRIAASA